MSMSETHAPFTHEAKIYVVLYIPVYTYTPHSLLYIIVLYFELVFFFALFVFLLLLY